MDYKIQDHLCSGDGERRPVTPPHILYFFIHKYFTPPLTYAVFTLSRENRVEQSARPTFDKGELVVQICILLQMNLEVKKDCKIRIVPPLFFFFYSALRRQHQQSAANWRRWGERLSARPMINFHSHLHLPI